MPGYKVATVEQVKGGVVCPHCGLILRDAVQTEEGIRLCESCFKDITLEAGNTCAKCGISVNPKQFWPDKAVRRDILEVLVRCTFHTNGCPWQGQLKHLEDHSQGCRYQPVQCPNPGCSELLAPEKMDKHIDQECQFRTVQCELCQENCLATRIEEHYNDCPKYPVICDQCRTKVARDELEEHKLHSCSVVKCLVPECEKLLAKLGTEKTADTAEYTNEHLTDPQEVFSHVQKLAFLTKSNHKMSVKLSSQYQSLMGLMQQSGVAPQAITTLQQEIQQQMEKLGKRLSLLERVVESRQIGVESTQAGKRDKNAGAKIEDLHLKSRQQNEKINQLEELVKRLQGQVELQSRAITQLQQHQGTTGSWKFAEGRSFETGITESRFVQLEKKIEEIERQTAMMKVHVSELELQLQASLASTHNGSFLWRIPDISRRRRDAIEERITSIYSPPFYTGRNGYKMCIRAYLNGDGIGYKTHFSIFFVLMKGEYDPLLKWPFEFKVSLILVDQNHRKHIVQTFKPTSESSSFQRPRSDMNVASGCPQFSKLNVLDDENYVKDDVLYIKSIIDTSRIFHP